MCRWRIVLTRQCQFIQIVDNAHFLHVVLVDYLVVLTILIGILAVRTTTGSAFEYQ